jgi:antirestriction protein
MLSDVTELLQRYLDYEAFGKDLYMDGYTEFEVHVFSNF